MSGRARPGMLAALLLFVAASGLRAQAWDAPAFFAPRAHDDLGLYAFIPEHGDLGAQAIWRQTGNLNLGVRAGVGTDLVLVGAEFYGPLALPQSPLLLAWQVGFGAGFNHVTLLRVPAGVSIGIDMTSQGLPQLTPYVFPRAALELAAWDEGGEEETSTDLALAVDVGADLVLTPQFILRAGFALADQTAFGVGIAYRMQRRIEVR